MSGYQPDGRSRSLRRQIEDARRLAVAGKWDEAVALNRQILEHSPRDVDAYNRLGKAYSELGQIAEALEAYRTALSLDPGNMIARRNLERLEQLGETVPPPEAARPGPPVRAGVFVEEVGKTYVTDLVRPASLQVLALVAPADEVELRVEGNQVHVYNEANQRLGQLEPWIAQRLIKLLSYGNRYRAYVVARSANTVRIILREVFRNPETPPDISFPRQAKIAAPRPYLREPSRAARDLESEFLLEEDEEEEEGAEAEELDEVDAIDEEDETDEDEEFVAADEEDDEEEDETGLEP